MTDTNTMTLKTVFSAEYQMSHYREPVYQVFADTRLEAQLTKGATAARSYASNISVNDVGDDGSYSTQAITDTQETLTISSEKEASVYIKDLEALQAHLPLKQKYGRKLANALINQIDGDVLGALYSGAGTTLDDGDFSGTDGNGITLTSSNIATVFVTAKQKLGLKNVLKFNKFKSAAGMKLDFPSGMPAAAISTEMLSYIELYLGGKDTLLGDQVSRNGYAGYFMGFELFVTNALPWTATLGCATIATDTDTVVINGVTFTADADGAATGAGHWSIQGSADLCWAQFADAVNNEEAYATSVGAVDTYIELTAANRALMANITATHSTSLDTVTLAGTGWGTVVVSETLTDDTDVFTTGLQQIHPIFALSKSISLVIQKNPSLLEKDKTGYIGSDFVAWTAYGMKVFVDQAPQIVQLAVNSAAFTAASTTVN